MNYQDYLAAAQGHWYVIGAVFVAVQTAIFAMVSRRWLIRTVVLWLLLPQIVYLVMMTYEMMTRPLPPNLGANIAMGLGFTTMFSIIPWAAVSAVGFLLGFVLRRFVQRSPAAA